MVIGKRRRSLAGLIDLRKGSTIMDATNRDGADAIVGPEGPSPWRRRLLWGCVWGVGALLAVALLVPATRSAPQAARRSRCQHNLARITQALLRYREVHGSFPPPFTRGPDGQPMHSWRTLILPHLGEAALFAAIDLSKPWDDPANDRSGRAMPEVYACPSSWAPAGQTTYQVVVAPESCFPPDGPPTLADPADASPLTLVVGDFPWRRAVDWMAPQDTDMKSWLALGNDGPINHGGAYFLFGAIDGSTRGINLDHCDSEQRRAWITVENDDPPDRR